jgi:hypothetical protein
VSDEQRRAATAHTAVALQQDASATLDRMQVIAPQCVRHMRGEPIDVAALEALGYRPSRTIFGDAVAFRHETSRDARFVNFGRTGCNVSQGNTILRNDDFYGFLGDVLAPLGFVVSRGNRVGLNNDATLLVANDMTLRVDIIATSRRSRLSPGIWINKM